MIIPYTVEMQRVSGVAMLGDVLEFRCVLDVKPLTDPLEGDATSTLHIRLADAAQFGAFLAMALKTARDQGWHPPTSR